MISADARVNLNTKDPNVVTTGPSTIVFNVAKQGEAIRAFFAK